MSPAIIMAVGWLLFGIWCLCLGGVWEALQSRWLRKRSARLADPATWPSLSVIVPARNEGASIEQGLRSLLAVDYPHLEIIAVDDRSTDITGAVMDQLAASGRGISGRGINVIHVTALPEGWLGKNHALYAGSAAATGDFLLFTDGDVLFEPDSIRRAVSYALDRRLDHLCLAPELIPGGLCENALNAYFGMIFLGAAHPWLVATSFKHAYSGVGAFNLVRRSAYAAVGGHERIRLDVLDDIDLGRLLKQSGFRQEFLLAGDLIRVRWQNSLWGVVRGLEKNGFAAFRYSLATLLSMTLFVLIITLAPCVAVLLLRDASAVPYAATLLLVHVTYAAAAWSFGCGLAVTPLWLFATVVFLFALWRSAWITLRQGGVRWRDTFYPLDLLRANIFRGM